jgi:hypothetical protein
MEPRVRRGRSEKNGTETGRGTEVRGDRSIEDGEAAEKVGRSRRRTAAPVFQKRRSRKVDYEENIKWTKKSKIKPHANPDVQVLQIESGVLNIDADDGDEAEEGFLVGGSSDLEALDVGVVARRSASASGHTHNPP